MAVQSYDTEHYTISLLLLSGGYLLFNLIWVRNRAALKNWLFLLLGQALAAFISALLYAPVLLAANREIAENGDYVTFPIRETFPGADFLSFFVPDGTSWYLGEIFGPVVQQFIGSETSFLGWTVLILAYVGCLRFYKNRQVWFWLTTALVFASLALGPYLIWGGEMKQVPGPFLLLQKLPLFNSTRAPVRFSLFAMLSASVLAGDGIKAIISLFRGRGWTHFAVPVVAMAVLAGMFVEYRPSVSLISTKPPKVYEEIARSDVPGAVLIVPLGWEATPHGGGNEMTFVELYQPEHLWPMVGGMAGRVPKSKALCGVYTPVLDFLAEPRTYEPSGPDRDEAAVGRLWTDTR